MAFKLDDVRAKSDEVRRLLADLPVFGHEIEATLKMLGINVVFHEPHAHPIALYLAQNGYEAIIGQADVHIGLKENMSFSVDLPIHLAHWASVSARMSYLSAAQRPILAFEPTYPPHYEGAD